jgi:hypothetical protein
LLLHARHCQQLLHARHRQLSVPPRAPSAVSLLLHECRCQLLLHACRRRLPTPSRKHLHRRRVIRVLRATGGGRWGSIACAEPCPARRRAVAQSRAVSSCATPSMAPSLRWLRRCRRRRVAFLNCGGMLPRRRHGKNSNATFGTARCRLRETPTLSSSA